MILGSIWIAAPPTERLNRTTPIPKLHSSCGVCCCCCNDACTYMYMSLCVTRIGLSSITDDAETPDVVGGLVQPLAYHLSFAASRSLAINNAFISPSFAALSPYFLSRCPPQPLSGRCLSKYRSSSVVGRISRHPSVTNKIRIVSYP